MDEETVDQLAEQASTFYELSLAYLSSPGVLFQLGIIVAAVVPAWFLSGVFEKKIESAVRRIHGMPGLLRVIAAFLRRLHWLFIAIFLGIAYVATRVAEWPDSNKLIYGLMLLSTAWLVISAVSRIIRRKTFAKIFALVAWVYVAAILLGITDDIRTILDNALIPVVEISLWRVMTSLIGVGILLWIALKLGTFLDTRIQTVEDLTPSLRVLLGKITRISLMIFAVLIGMQLLNLNLTALTVLFGAVGVGIGFGLQKVVSNFISGIIILLDESIKLGDTFGWVRELRARCGTVLLRLWDVFKENGINIPFPHREVIMRTPVTVQQG